MVEPPRNWPTPLTILVPGDGAGKKFVPSIAAEFGLIMQDGMMLPGNVEPCVTPGFTPPQLANRTEGATWVVVGTRNGAESELKSPP